MPCSGRRVRIACSGNCRQLAKNMAAAVRVMTICAQCRLASGVSAATASSKADRIHSAFSRRGNDWRPKRQVKMQKQATYSTRTMTLARAAIRVVGNGQGLVTSTLAMNSTQNRAISAYQP
ncbi:hypothetical protein D3C87_1817550 [compost metagenome]